MSAHSQARHHAGNLLELEERVISQVEEEGTVTSPAPAPAQHQRGLLKMPLKVPQMLSTQAISSGYRNGGLTASP